jgi:PAS domain S-box-containing protein
LRLQASAGEPRAPNDAVEHVPLGRFLVGWIAQHRAPCLTNDLLHDARFEHRAWAARELLVAACGLPLVVEQRLVGVIAVFSRQPLSGDTLGDLTSIADLIAQGIERKRAELVLQESENRYRELFHSNPHPMWVYDRETLAFLDVNEAALRHYGYTREEFLRMTIRDIRPAEDVPRLLAYLETTADECREAGTWQHRLKDGGVIDVEIRSNAIRFAGRRAEVVLALDVTERRRAEAALRELPQRILEAQEAERRRVARDLHDSVCQLLSSVRFRLQGLEGKLAALDAGPLEELAQISGYIGKALDETRRISRNLRPSELDELGLAAALRLLAGDFAEHTGITCELACPELPATLEQGIELALYRIVQEALNNVEKHAQASRVAVDVSLRPGQLTACVRDDGRGFLLGAGNGTESAGAARPGGFGLVSMRERAALIGGTVRLVSAPGRGTEVRADIPLSERSEAGRAKAKGQGRRGT